MEIRVYGTSWCGDVKRAREYLSSKSVDYEFIDIDRDKEAERNVLEWNDGKRRVPTIVIEEEQERTILRNPPRETLEALISEKRTP